MSKKKANKYLFFDTETTGLPCYEDYIKFWETYNTECCRLVQLAYILCDKDRNIIEQGNSIIRPEGFTIGNNHIHGITQEKALAEGESLKKGLDKFCQYTQRTQSYFDST